MTSRGRQNAERGTASEGEMTRKKLSKHNTARPYESAF